MTALKYNVSSLVLNIDNTFVDPFFRLTGGYSINRTGGNSYSLSGWTDGTFAFGSNGSPAATPSLTAQGTAFTNLPNQNNSYRLAGGDVTRLKYDLAAAGKTLGLALDGSYVVQAGATILESGTYAMTPAGSDVYTLTGNNASATARFTNLPNQNDDYQVVGNQLTRLKYGLVSQGGSTCCSTSTAPTISARTSRSSTREPMSSRCPNQRQRPWRPSVQRACSAAGCGEGAQLERMHIR